MHENRETSETPAVKPGGRSVGEGDSRTARADVSEESHSGILPMNCSNNDKTSSAESREGRPLIKENAGQPNTYPTQSGKGVSQGLAGVRQAARENKEMKFTALLHHLTLDLLRESFYSLKKKAAPGVDGVTWYEFETGLEDRLTDLHGRVHWGALDSFGPAGSGQHLDLSFQNCVHARPRWFHDIFSGGDKGTRCWTARANSRQTSSGVSCT